MKREFKCFRCGSDAVNVSCKVVCTNKDCGYVFFESETAWGAYKRWCVENGKKYSSADNLQEFRFNR